MNRLRRPRRQREVRCPFYGFAWPPATTRLVQVETNRCGLALDRLEPCAMEEAGEPIDMDRCPLVQRWSHFIRSAAPVMLFITRDHPEGVKYADWVRDLLRRA